MVKIQIKEVYKNNAKPTQTLQISLTDKEYEVTNETVTSTVRNRIKELTDRVFNPNDKLQAFYVSVTEE